MWDWVQKIQWVISQVDGKSWNVHEVKEENRWRNISESQSVWEAHQWRVFSLYAEKGSNKIVCLRISCKIGGNSWE